MRQCLYCLHQTEGAERAGEQCGMPRPRAAPRQLQRRRQRRFAWFCAGLALFCLGMMLWLPRNIP
ncbi:protein DnrP [Pseudomonas aeruginosa]|nr:protein DnrP [Pseudomonas aeruginosa]